MTCQHHPNRLNADLAACDCRRTCAIPGCDAVARSAELLRKIKAADTEQLAVSEEDGRFLRVMVASSGARRALEIGGANGYSAIWIGLGLRETGGRLTTIEVRSGARQSRRREHPAGRSRRHRHGRVGRRVRGDSANRGRLRFRVSRRLEARLQAILRPGVAAAPSARPVSRAQRRQQADRDARLSCRDPERSGPVHDDRRARAAKGCRSHTR